MALNTSGPMSLGGSIVGQSINLELNLLATATASIGQADFRALAQKPSGVISLSDFYGKSNIIVIPPVTTDTANLVITAYGIPGYVPGESKVELTINSGVYLYSTDTSQPALKFIDFVTGDQIVVVNNGFIMGKGGKGGGRTNGSTGQPGGPAISTNVNISIVNNSYIGGGGGGGSAYVGGGGAGGGDGGEPNLSNQDNPNAIFGVGGAPGMMGTAASGYSITIISNRYGLYAATGAGGGGGRIFPGTGGAGGPISNGVPSPPYAQGGGAGGGGASAVVNLFDSGSAGLGGAGGAGGSPGATSIEVYGGGGGGGGGGGWGASGGTTIRNGTPGGIGGKAIELNGKTATISGTGTVFGAVS